MSNAQFNFMAEPIESLQIEAELEEESSSIKWKKPTESMFLVQQLVRKGVSPRQILSLLYPIYSVPVNIPDIWILQLLRELCEQRTREKLPQWNTFPDAVELFRKSNRILIITGAGVSVSCGIPDFRSKDGIYARLHKDFPELPDPHSMFDIDFFRRNPAPFYNFAREIFPGQFRPSISHMFIKFLEEERKLLRNYTQNIDTLERVAGIRNLVECHGSFAKSTCLECRHEVDSEMFREQIFAQRIVHCPKCLVGVMKPNIVFFGEDLGDSFHSQMGEDHENLDLLVVIGSSMQVRPVSLIPFNIAPEVPQILVNREQLPNYPADIKLLGNCDAILAQLALAIGGQMREKMLTELQSREKPVLPPDVLTRAKQSEEPVLPRRLDVDEFKRMIGAGRGKEESASGEPDEKRPKLDDGKGEATTSLWEGNYLLVESRLPAPDSTLLVPPNLNVFAGAELYYDRDQDTFVRRAGVKQRYEDEEEELDFECTRSTSSSSSSSSSGSQRGGSLPPELEGGAAENGGLDIRRRSGSCPPPSSGREE